MMERLPRSNRCYAYQILVYGLLGLTEILLLHPSHNLIFVMKTASRNWRNAPLTWSGADSGVMHRLCENYQYLATAVVNKCEVVLGVYLMHYLDVLILCLTLRNVAATFSKGGPYLGTRDRPINFY